MTALLTRFARVPAPVRFGVTGVGAGGIGFLAYSMFGAKGLLFFTVGLVLVAVLLSLYAFIIRMAAKRKAARFGRQMLAQSGAAPRSVSTAEQLAKLDDLRGKFGAGVETFRTAGKDIYSLPWYLVVGEPGSGKTEAIRRSGIGFPPGLQDELQGAGGTINMSWWFSNSAVILDTAGRLMFEEVEAGSTSEWQEFLRLLRTCRRNCPINGLILAIPADSLIRDSADQIRQKAQRIVRQLDVIQRTLDVRFPVFVMITKADLVNGFREFFGDLNTPEQQHQILGWSNPQPIDQAFDPEQLETYLAPVRQTLERRRLLLLRDPVPSQALTSRRLDEADTLFDFPRSFERLVPQLQQYLRLCFVSGEWSAKPLFLRGIYFTSSMREGAVLDAELAEALGVPLDSLPEGRAWERDRAFFLRDLFLRKVFAERGLVTRATNVEAQHRQRQMLILGAGFASALLLLLLTWLGGFSLKRTIVQERDLWQTLETMAGDEAGWRGHWPMIVAPDPDSAGVYTYQGPARVRVPGMRVTVSGLQRELQKKVQNPIRVPFIFRVFRPFSRSLEDDRRAARRILFETCVLSPTVQAAREKMLRETPATWTDKATAALGELVRIEADAEGLPYRPEDTPGGLLRLNALFDYVLTRPEDLQACDDTDRDLWDQVLAWSYDRDGGRGKWPPAALSAGRRLADNRAVARGAECFTAHCGNPPAIVSLNTQLGLVKDTWRQLTEFERGAEKDYTEAERRFLAVFAGRLDRMTELSGFQEMSREWRDEYDRIGAARARMTEPYAVIESAGARIPLCQSTNTQARYREVVSNALAEAAVCLRGLPLPKSRADLRAEKGEIIETDAEETLVDDIQKLMRNVTVDTRQRLDQPGIPEQLAEFAVQYARCRERVGAAEARFAAYAPLSASTDLAVQKTTWELFVSRLHATRVPETHESLETLCKRIDGVFAKLGEASPDLPKESIAAIRDLAGRSLARIGSQNFKVQCETAMDNWRRLSGNAVQDRFTLLALPLKDFSRDYLVMSAAEAPDYVIQFWDTLIATALESLADQTIREAQTTLQEIRTRNLARFPLDLPRTGVASLSVAELADAVAALKRVQPWPAVAEPKTLGDGADTGRPRIDQQLQRLRDLDLGEQGAWVAAAKSMVAGLPAGPDRRLACTVWLPPYTEQERLIKAHGGRSLRDDSVLPVWRIVGLAEGEGQAPALRLQTGKDARTQVGRVFYPGNGLEVLLYRYNSDAKPDRTVAFRDPWGCLRMLHDCAGERLPTEPTRWNVPIAVEDAGRQRVLWLELEFEQPVPALADWPSTGRSQRRAAAP